MDMTPTGHRTPYTQINTGLGGQFGAAYTPNDMGFPGEEEARGTLGEDRENSIQTLGLRGGNTVRVYSIHFISITADPWFLKYIQKMIILF